MSQDNNRSFSNAWCIASLVLYTAVEVVLGTFVGPFIVGTYVSPMLHMRVMTAMHLASFFLGGVVVGIISPGVRLLEPAVGAFLAVAVAMMMAIFMPTRFMSLSLDKLMLGGGVAFALALAGAWMGEKWMGNVDDGDESARGRIRKQLWEGERGLLVSKSRLKHLQRR